ncbi:MAG: hypothetical protein LBU34_14885 [Planctomycetaceae bacterium]|nr:hypothetical protein [Planctomycetaceae bacterium]
MPPRDAFARTHGTDFLPYQGCDVHNLRIGILQGRQQLAVAVASASADLHICGRGEKSFAPTLRCFGERSPTS